MPKQKAGTKKKSTKKNDAAPQEDCLAIGKSLYFAKVKLAGKECSAQGATLEEAISNLKPRVKKGTCLLTIAHDGKEVTRILSGPLTFKLFNIGGRFTKEVAFKNLKVLFGL